MLIYIGKGAFLQNIPARDLNADEVSQFGKSFLIESGLYAEPVEKKTATKTKEIPQ